MTTLATVQDRPKGVVAPAQARKMFRMERYLPALLRRYDRLGRQAKAALRRA